jgi:hypothetical protein
VDSEFLSILLAGIVPPAAVALVAWLVVRTARRPEDEEPRGAFAGVLAVGVGYVGGHLAILGVPELPWWHGVDQGVAYVAVAFTAWGLVESLARPRAMVRHAGRLALGFLFAWTLLDFVREYDWSTSGAVLRCLGMAALLLVGGAALDAGARRAAEPGLPLALAVVVGLSGAAQAQSGGASLGQLTGALAVPCGIAGLLAFFQPAPRLAGGAVAPLLGVHGALLVSGHYASELPGWSALLLALAPLAAAAGAAVGRRGERRWRELVLATVAGALVAGAGLWVAIASVPENPYAGY